MWCRYNVVNFVTNVHKIHPIAWPLGRGMGVSFVYLASDWYSASVPVIIYVISYNFGLRYNGTWPYYGVHINCHQLRLQSELETHGYMIHVSHSRFVICQLRSANQMWLANSRVTTGWLTKSQICDLVTSKKMCLKENICKMSAILIWPQYINTTPLTFNHQPNKWESTKPSILSWNKMQRLYLLQWPLWDVAVTLN